MDSFAFSSLFTFLALSVACTAGSQFDDAKADASDVSDGGMIIRDCRAPVSGSTSLFDTGLYCAGETGTLGNGVRPYSAKFPLWADGAAKSRWVLLPEGQSIDTSDMDNWHFPVGTQLWKEFSKNGKRVETRLMTRTGDEDDSWTFKTYAWNEAQDDAIDTFGEEVENALGTDHTIPSSAACESCHSTTRAKALGFSAIQLDNESIVQNEVTLKTLIDEGALSQPPSGTSPYFTPPGSPTASNALGYLHANCGGCHNEFNPTLGNGLNLRLRTSNMQELTRTEIYTSTVNIASRSGLDRVDPGNPEGSELLNRVSRRPGGMPPIATDVVDELAQLVLRAWICELGECSDGSGGGGGGGGGIDLAAPPQNLRGTVYSSSALELFWDRNNALVNYEIVMDGVTIRQTNGVSHFQSGLTAGTNYAFEVIGIDGAGKRTAPAGLSLQTNE